MAYEQKPIVGAFKGIIDNLPRPYKPDQAWDDILNMFVRQGRLISRPRLNASVSPPDGAILRNMVPFNDILGNLHNLALTTQNAYMVTSGPTYNGPLLLPTWSASPTYALNDAVNYLGTTYVAILAGVNHQPDISPTFWAPIQGNVINTALPWGYAITQGKVFFSNGSFPGLYADGEATIKSAKHPGSWRFCAVLANHLLTTFTTEPAPQVPNSVVYPYRVRWSASGDATAWTVGAGTSAGFADLLEVPDQLTGIAALGRSGYIYRSNGITLVTPTGVGTAPFQFDQVTNSPKGVGNYFPYSLDTYGGVSIFVAEEDIYLFDGTSFVPIGGEAKNRIFSDLGSASGDQVFGTVLARLDPTFPYLSYWLSLPASSGGGGPVVWIYSWNDQSWMRFNSGAAQMTAIARMVL